MIRPFSQPVIAGVLIIGALALVWNGTRSIRKGPTVTIHEPAYGQNIETRLVSLVGTTRNISSLWVNGAEITPQVSGDISYTTLVVPGVNHFSIRAVDNFGKERTWEHVLWGQLDDFPKDLIEARAAREMPVPQEEPTPDDVIDDEN